MKNKKPSQLIFILAGTFTILGAFAQLFNMVFAPYIFSIGAGLLIFIHGKEAFYGKVDGQQRLARLGLFTSLMLGIAAYFMFTHSNSWVVFVLIYALSSFYQSFRGTK
jgi:uncharacterized membrane protein HdeD (DUF308 family)